MQLPALVNTVEQQRADSLKAIECITCESQYYGRGIDVSYDIKNNGELHVLADSGKVWLLRLKSATAFGMQFYFDKFNLPEGAQLFILNSDSSTVLGAYTAENNPSDPNKIIKFGTPPIGGNDILIEYYEPSSVQFPGEVSLTNIIHIFKESGPFMYGTGAAPCNINVACPEGNGWGNEISSVALILTYNSQNKLVAVCSGAVVNNTAEDGVPYFLTAEHCISTNLPIYDSDTWTFLFNHQSPNCDGSGYIPTGTAVYGSLVRTRDGAGSPTSDYALLELNTSTEYLAINGVCYAGWSLDATPQGPFVGIHHPRGDIKKISIAPSVSSLTSNYWAVDWSSGTTEAGSSGSPLFDVNHRIIGHDYAGNSVPPCDPTKGSAYGRFPASWNNGGFAFWLDPYSTGQLSVDTYCPVSAGDSGGIGGGGGSTSNCRGPLDIYGFNVNGNNTPVTEVCVGDDIMVGCNPKDPVACPTVRFSCVEVRETESRVGGCDIESDYGAYNCSNIPVFRCECYFDKLYISVTRCDANLNPIGTQYHNWMVIPVAEQSIFNLYDHLPSSSINFHSGETYRVIVGTIAGTTPQFFERFIHFYEDNRIINNASITSNVYGEYVTINNSTIDANVTAKEEITINSNSTLLSGVYEIGPVNCDGFMRPASQNGDGGLIYNQQFEPYYYQGENQINVGAKQIESNRVNIYPNPNAGLFNIVINTAKKPDLIEVYNIVGKRVFDRANSDNQPLIDITDQPKGIYFVKVTVGSTVFNEKIVYQ